MRFHSKLGHRTESINVVLRTTAPITSRATIGMGVAEQIANVLKQGGSGRNVLVVTQTSVRKLYADDIFSLIKQADFNAEILELPDGEEAKSHESLLVVWAKLQELKFTRADTLVAVGGGAITDLAGFAASTYLRGIKLVLVPTTLLAQVDAAIGGKTGINLAAGKNLAGSFYFPETVIVDPAVLETLPERELRSGLGEIIKYALIENTIIAQTEFRGGQRPLLKVLEDVINGPGFSATTDGIDGIIATCIKMKLAVVGKDPFEGKLRRCLNLGHTLAHGIEKVTNFAVSHGEAVAIGTVFACRIATKLQRFDESDTDRVIALLRRANLPTEVPEGLAAEDLLRAMAFDKKKQGDAINFVLPIRPLGTVDLDCKLRIEELSEFL